MLTTPTTAISAALITATYGWDVNGGYTGWNWLETYTNGLDDD